MFTFTETQRLFLLSFSVVLSLAMIVYSLLRGKRTPAFRSYILVHIILFIWLVVQIIRLYVTTPDAVWLMVRAKYFPICFVGVSWLVFSLYYTEKKIATTRNIILLTLPALFFYFMVLTNELHHLFFSGFAKGVYLYGPLFYIHVVESYSYFLIGMALVIHYGIKHFGYTKIQSFLLVIAVTIPLTINMLIVTRIFFPGFDMTPISFSISLLFFITATFRYKLLNIVPIAFSKIVDNMKESIIVADSFNQVVECNNSFRKTFGRFHTVQINQPIALFAESLQQHLDHSATSALILQAIKEGAASNVSGELDLIKPLEKCFFVNIQPIFSGKECIGRVISFNEITAYRNLLEELNQKNQELRLMNQQLEEYTATAEELAVVKERNRLAREVHDTLGQTMTLLITLLQVSSITYRKDPAQAEEKLAQAIKVAGAGLKEVRRSISGLIPERLESSNLPQALRDLIADYQALGIKVDYTMDGFENLDNLECSSTVFRICQEALTNSLRHGQATQVTIIIQSKDGWLKLFIFDNGRGCRKLDKGLGLSGMEARVAGLNGSISYGSDGESGFNIHAEIPLGVVMQ